MSRPRLMLRVASRAAQSPSAARRVAVVASVAGAVLAAGCAGAEYRAGQEYPRLVAPVRLAEGNTGKPEARPASGAKAADGSRGTHLQKKKSNSDASESSDPSAPEGEAESAAAQRVVPGTELPDPTPLLGTRHFDLEFAYDRGAIALLGAREVTTQHPVPTRRTMGRYAFELWIGRELIDRVRFDFPLLGAEAPEAEVVPLHAQPSLGAGARVRRTVLVPASERATSARLVDRATGEVTPLPWPPLVAKPPTP